MSTELAVTEQNTELATPHGVGLDEALQELRPVAMILKQKTTEGYEEVPNGKFIDTSTGEVHDRVTLVPMEIRKTRALYPHARDGRPFKSGEDPICKSRDAVKPLTGIDELKPQAATCASCKWSKWDNATGTKPACKESMNITYIEKGSGLPFFTILNGLSVKEGKALETGMARKSLATKAKTGHQANIFDFQVLMTSAKVETSSGTSQVAKFPNTVLLGPDDEDYSLFHEQYIAGPRRRYLEAKNAPAPSNTGGEYVEEAGSDVVDVEEIIDVETV